MPGKDGGKGGGGGGWSNNGYGKAHGVQSARAVSLHHGHLDVRETGETTVAAAAMMADAVVDLVAVACSRRVQVLVLRLLGP